MLDDLKYIHERDAQDALGVAGKAWQQLQHHFDVKMVPQQPIQNMVVAGMGGSAWPALFLNTWPGLPVPLEIVRQYSIPPYVNEQTLFISSSYSGNTEEALAALEEAEQKKAQIVVMADGGQLQERAKQHGHPLFLIPSGIQPRMASLYFFTALIQLLGSLDLIAPGKQEELKASGDWLGGQVGAWGAEVPTAQNMAKQIALELMGKTAIVYSGPLLFPAANKWKICINENAKNLAWANQYPEFNHNEFIGWTSHPVSKPFAVVEIRSDLEHPRVQKRFEVSERLLSGKRPSPIVIKPEGSTVLRQLLWSENLADFVSIYLALLNGINPTPVDLIEKFKKELG